MSVKEIGTIYLEGTDCTGKDVVGGIIASKYGITNIQKLSLHANNPWDADKTGELMPGHPLFSAYLLRSIIWDIQHFDSKSASPQLQISFFASRSAAWCLTTGDHLGNVYQELLEYSPVFEHSFLLCASVEVKQDRLKRRMTEGGKSSEIDKLVFTKPDFVSEMDRVLARIMQEQMGVLIVDTDNLSIKGVGDILIADINGITIRSNDKNCRKVQMDIAPELQRFHREIVLYTNSVAKSFGLSESMIEKVKNPLTYKKGH
jgi:hypothetical protein